MKLRFRTLFLCTALATCLGVQAQDADPATEGEKVLTEGVEPGKPTQDYEAAMKFAAEKKLPVMLNFTGSDWCGWCKLMDGSVFSKPEWAEYAKESVVQVWLDFPRNKDLVPEKYRARNNELKDKYGIRGFPTYVILDSTGSKIGQLSAGRGKTPASFQAELDKILVVTDAGIKKFCDKIKPEDAKSVREQYDVTKAAKAEKAAAEQKLAEASKKAEAAEKALKEAMTAAKVNAMTPEVKAEYDAAKAALDEAKKTFTDWLAAQAGKRPTRATQQEGRKLQSAVMAAQAKVDSF